MFGLRTMEVSSLWQAALPCRQRGSHVTDGALHVKPPAAIGFSPQLNTPVSKLAVALPVDKDLSTCEGSSACQS